MTFHQVHCCQSHVLLHPAPFTSDCSHSVSTQLRHDCLHLCHYSLRSYFIQTSLMSKIYILKMHVTFKDTFFSTLYFYFVLYSKLLFPCSVSSFFLLFIILHLFFFLPFSLSLFSCSLFLSASL